MVVAKQDRPLVTWFHMAGSAVCAASNDFVRTEGKSMKPVMMADLASTWG
jgi:hypothetical protein